MPQDVIQEIINHLHNDPDTLKSCAVVSHSFLPTSRKHLFFSIHLDHPRKPQRFYEVLSAQPDIANFVRELYAIGVGSDEEVWLEGEVFLPRILRLVNRLGLLSLDARPFRAVVAWYHFSIDLQSAVTEILLSPFLVEMRFISVNPMSISIIARSSHLRRLALLYSDVYGESDLVSNMQASHVQTSPLTSLEALELGSFQNDVSAEMFLVTRRLRLLSILTCGKVTLSVARDVIRSAASSIHSIVWRYSSECMFVFALMISILMFQLIAIAATIQLGMIRNLRFLLFSISMARGSENRHFRTDIHSIIWHLEDPTVTANLQELTIAINTRRYWYYEEVVESLATYQGWEMLDSVLLGRGPVLRKVHIAVELNDVDYPDIHDELQTTMELRLPRLAERGILVAECRRVEELEAIAWSRSRLE